ncbi:MAG: hypothetical protein ACQERK_06145 [Campylobacterota bacterium]
MNDKYLLILDTLIKEFIKIKDPIGSQHLKEVIETDMSSATIRYYFKKMASQGQIVQLHRSGGRIPADATLFEYWKGFFDSIDDSIVVNIASIEHHAKKYGIFACVRPSGSNLLQEVKNIENRYLLVVFELNEIAVKYNRLLEKFLNDFLGNEIEKVAAVITQIGIEPFATKIIEALASNIKTFNKPKLFEADLDEEFGAYYDGTVINIAKPIEMYDQMLKVKLRVQNVDGQMYDLFVFSELTGDFKNFIRSIRE